MSAVLRDAWAGDRSPRFNARVAGVLTLLTIVLGVVAEGVISTGAIGRDPARVAANVVAHASEVRLGFAIYMVEMACMVATTTLFYDLLKPVSPSLSLMVACLSLVGCAIKAAGRVFFVAPLFIVEPASFAQALGPESTRAMAHFLLRLTDRAAEIGLVFFGFSTLLRGYLVLRSTFLPSALGVLGIVDGALWLLYLSPPLAHRWFGVIALVALLGSLATIGWLIVVGVDETKWKARAGITKA